MPSCLICGAANASCGDHAKVSGAATDLPTIPTKGEKMAYQGPLVRVDRGDGILIKMTRQEAQRFIRANAGAKRVATPSGRTGPAAVEVEEEGDGSIESMTVNDLRNHAEEKNIDLSGARTKDQILERIRDAEAEAELDEVDAEPEEDEEE